MVTSSADVRKDTYPSNPASHHSASVGRWYSSAMTRIEMFNVGWFTVAAGLVRAGDDMEEPVRFPVPAYLIETETQRILVDTGLHPERLDSVGPFELEQELSIADQVDVTTLTKVVLTHLHFDHAGALSLIPAAVPVVVQRDEWAAGHAPEAMHLPLGQLAGRVGAVAGAPGVERVVVVCKVGGRSQHAAQLLAAHGADVVNVSDGMLGWERAGRPMVSETGAAPAVI